MFFYRRLPHELNSGGQKFRQALNREALGGYLRSLLIPHRYARVNAALVVERADKPLVKDRNFPRASAKKNSHFLRLILLNSVFKQFDDVLKDGEDEPVVLLDYVLSPFGLLCTIQGQHD